MEWADEFMAQDAGGDDDECGLFHVGSWRNLAWNFYYRRSCVGELHVALLIMLAYTDIAQMYRQNVLIRRFRCIPIRGISLGT